MDFMKVLDQTVREIKREVNLKVLKVPEIEQKVLDATSNEPWGPHGSALTEIAHATKKITDCQMIMNVLWTRLTDVGSNWRHVYKALAVIEYLVANGSERAVDDIIEHTFRISSISGFEYVEPNGKDVGINVRKKVETILSLMNDKEKIQAVRDKAAANRDKYFGLSSTGITFKSSSTSYGTSNFRSGDRYGGLGSSKEDDSFKDNYKERERYEEETNWNHGTKGGRNTSKGILANEHEQNKSKKGATQDVRDQDSTPLSTSRTSTKSDPISKSSNAQQNDYDDDFDDFDPRGSSTAGLTKTTQNQVDLVGQSLVGDLMDAPTSIPTETTTLNTAAVPEVDLFADATYVSAPFHAEATGVSHTEGNVDLFATQPAFPAAFSSNVDLLGGPHASAPSETKISNFEPANTNNFDPFAAISLNSFEGSDVFGAFASHSAPVTVEPSQNFANNSINDLYQPSQNSANNNAQNSANNNVNDLNQSYIKASKPAPKKDTFQVKSGIWADSLSRGIIDLNITAPKKVSLADIGIVGGLDDGYDGAYTGRAMGAAGSRPGGSGFTSSTAMGGSGKNPTLGQHQFGSFK